MIGLALLLQTSIAVSATADRTRLPVGEEVSYSLRATTTAAGNFRVELPQVTGFEVVERAERLDETAAGRTYQLDLTLRAVEVGSWRFGPVLVFVGPIAETAPDLTIVVVGAAAADPTANPRLMELIRAMPPPDPGSTATLVTVVSDRRLPQGGQLDVLTGAWFSRALRARLRRPPTLKPPVLAGVWAVPQPAVPGIVATRAVGEDVHDLFVSHQVAFPLTPGVLTVPAARLEYAIPLSRRASGDERPEVATSAPVTVEIQPLPEAGRPGGFRGPTAGDLSLGYRIVSLPAHAGEPLPIDVTVSGIGNLAFWAPPNVTWPAGTRAYLDQTDEAPRESGGLLGGTKTFRFLLVSDSAGSIALPALGYDYFDRAGGGYRSATAAGLVIPVLPGKSRLVGRDVPPLVAAGGAPGWLPGLRPGRWLWNLLAAGPALLLAGAVVVRRLRRRQPAVAPRERIDGVAALEHLVSRLVPESDRGHGELLERSLRRAGLARPQATEAARLKLELDRLRFTPGDSSGVGPLGRRAAELVGGLPISVRRRAGLVAALLLALPLSAQQESPETLYRDGAYRPAAAGFEAAAAATPERWQPWYHGAAARYLAGEDAAAAALLTRALELAPRAAPARTLWSALERQYEPLHQVRPRRGPSGWELGVISLGIWSATAAVALGWWRRPRLRWGAVLIGCLGLGAAWQADRPSTDRAYVASATRLRRSPHGLSPDEGGVPALTRVVVVRRQGDWALVTDRVGNRGWVPVAGLAPVDRLN
ncbi:MAG: hypothetical protein SFV24_01195 [Gemmatimonadales bacterium]|nr:hypothetical protein [Gemmatimonadales bacterium]